MNTIHIVKAALIAVGIMTSGLALAHGAGEIGPADTAPAVTLIYTNAAYTHAIHGSPNSAPELVVGRPNPVYVSQAAGPAIYSYPGADTASLRYLCER
jgi:hypothetical protein